jgi:CBS domain containing-hemolysin-like protein
MLLAKFRQGSAHFALATDAFGSETGFVTFEHVIEAFLGPVDDEFHKEAPQWEIEAGGSITGPASLSLLSLEDALGTTVPTVDANSVGGLVIEKLGRIPAPGERVSFESFEVEILSVDGPRIDRVRVRKAAQ